jgi:mono/diheme cytochrome c family protein
MDVQVAAVRMAGVRLAVAGIVSAAVIALAHVPLTAGRQAAGSVWDGVYTDAQAARGEAIYNDKCAHCHGPAGAGGDAPSLVGSEFAADWDGLSVGNLFDRTRSSMPQDNPQTLMPEETASLLAFIFKKNNLPAGQADLSDRADILAQIKYTARKP